MYFIFGFIICIYIYSLANFDNLMLFHIRLLKLILIINITFNYKAKSKKVSKLNEKSQH